jgi:DNA-directed RNA polymerase subunit RPC12/RpoP
MIADRGYKSETTISEGTLMSSGVEYSTAIVFLCSDCGTAYKAVQKLTESKQLGYFDCSECNSLVHSWHDVYDYSAWTPIFAAPRRRPKKRLKMNGPRRAPPRWTQQEEQQLLEMANSEMTAPEMARTLKRTPGSIYSRLQRLYRRQGG